MINFKVYYFFMMLGIVRGDIPSIETVDNEFNMFVHKLILKNFNSSNYIGIFHDYKGICDINLPRLLQSLHVPVIVHDLFKPEVSYNSSDMWIPNHATELTNDNLIIIEDSKDLGSMLKVALAIPSFSARKNVLIILTRKVSGTDSWIRKVFSQLWKVYILNVGLVFYNNGVNLFTYIPWTSPHEIQNLTDQEISANIFYDKLKNLRRYPIKILRNTFDMKMIAVNENNSTTYIGSDGMTMRTILELHNATSNITNLQTIYKSPCRFVHYNHTIQGVFGADARNKSIGICPFSLHIPPTLKKPSELVVIIYEIDVSFNLRPTRFDLDYRVDTSFIQQWDSYCVLVPANNRVPQAINLLLPLQGYMWPAVVLNFIIHTIIYFGIHRLDKSNKKGFLHTCLILYGIQMNSIVPNLKKLRSLEKAYLLSWVLYSFFISAAYHSVLISFITVPFYVQPIDRIQDLKEMKFSIFTQLDILTDMPHVIENRTGHILREKIVPDSWVGDRKYDVKNGYLMLESEARLLLQQKDFMDKNGRPLFHIMSERPVPLLMSYQMPRGSPLLQMINQFTAIKKESGLDRVWIAESKRYLRSQVLARNEYCEKHVKLTIAHLEGAFYCLFIGKILGITAFLGEIYWKRTRRFIPIIKRLVKDSD